MVDVLNYQDAGQSLVRKRKVADSQDVDSTLIEVKNLVNHQHVDQKFGEPKKVVNYEDLEQELIKAKKQRDPAWEKKVSQRVYDRVSWNDTWKIVASRKNSSRTGICSHTLDQAFEKKIHKSVVGQFLEDAKLPANRDVREAMIDILEYDWKSYTKKQWKKFINKNDFINNPIACLTRAINKNDGITKRWLEGVATTLRLIASGITKVGQTVKRFKGLLQLSLGGNEIEVIEGQHLPRDLRVLELAGNRISSLDKLVNHAPKGLIFLGLSQNSISNEQELQPLSASLHCLKVLDLEDNNLKNLTNVLIALKPIETLRALILEGNPCTTCLGYSNAVLSTIPSLIYLDNVVVKPNEKCGKEQSYDPDKLSTGVLFMHVYRIIHLEKPPKVKQGKYRYFFEVDLPLLDAHLILQEEMAVIRETFAQEGMELPFVYNNNKANKKRQTESISRTTAIRSEEFEWKELLFFNEPIMDIPPFDNDLKLLSDTFKSVVTVRLVRQKFSEDFKRKKSRSSINIPLKERTEMCKFTCSLKNMSWAERTQDFAWTFGETEDDSAKLCPPNTLPQQKYTIGDPNKGKKSTKSLHKQESLIEKEPMAGEAIPLPQKFTIHVGFGLRRSPDFDPIVISLPTKVKLK